MNCVLFPPISNDVLEKIFCSTQLSFKKKKLLPISPYHQSQ